MAAPARQPQPFIPQIQQNPDPRMQQLDNDIYSNNQINRANAFYQGATNAAVKQGQDIVDSMARKGQEQLDVANQYYQDIRNLRYEGVPDNTDYNFKTGLANQRIDANNASMEAMNKRLNEGGGLQSGNTSLSNLYGGPTQREINTRDAATLNADADRMKSQREEYNAEQDRQFANWRAGQNEMYRQQEKPVSDGGLGLKNGNQAAMDTRGLVGQYNMIMKSGQAKGLKFTDFIQNKIDNNELDPGSDAVKIISQQYGKTFEQPSDTRALDYVNTWGDPAAAARGAAEQQQADRQKASDEGMARRRETAMQQGQDRAAVANLIGKGYTPAQANAAVARDNQIGAYYNMAGGLANAELQSRERIAEGRNQTDKYQTDAMIGDRAAERKAERDLRMYEQDRQQRARMEGIAEKVQAEFPGQDIYQTGTAANNKFINEQRIAQGKPPIDFYQSVKNNQNRSALDSKVFVDGLEQQVRADNSINAGSDSSAINQIFNKAIAEGASTQEQLDLASRFAKKNLSDPENAANMLNEIMDTAIKNATKAAQGDTNAFRGGRKDFEAAMNTSLKSHANLINALKSVIPEDQLREMQDKVRRESEGKKIEEGSPLWWKTTAYGLPYLHELLSKSM